MKHLKVLLTAILVLTLSFGMTGCIKQSNPNVTNTYEQAVVMSSVMTDWYVEQYGTVKRMNVDPLINENDKKIIRTKINPAMDQLKLKLVEFNTLLGTYKNVPTFTLTDEQTIEQQMDMIQSAKDILIVLLLEMEGTK